MIDWLQVLAAGAGALGFALYFRIKLKNLLVATLGGILAWILYCVLYHYTANIFLSNIGSAFFVGLWAEIMARVMKVSANVFIGPGVVPMLPGGALYYTMSALLSGELDTFRLKGLETLYGVLGLATGILLTSVLFLYYTEITSRLSRRSKKQG